MAVLDAQGRREERMVKAFWNGYEIIEIEYHTDCVDIVFQMDYYHSPLTGTGRRLVRMEDIVLEEA